MKLYSACGTWLCDVLLLEGLLRYFTRIANPYFHFAVVERINQQQLAKYPQGHDHRRFGQEVEPYTAVALPGTNC